MFGLIAAQSDRNLQLTDISVKNFKLHLGNYSTSRNTGDSNKTGSCGGLVGSLSFGSSDKLLNCRIESYDAYFDVYEPLMPNYSDKDVYKRQIKQG